MHAVSRAVLSILLLPGLAAADSALLPDARPLAETAARKMRDSFRVLRQYTYDVVEKEERLDSAGRVTKTKTKGYEVFYVLGRPVRRQVSENGVPLDAKRRREQERKAEERVKQIRSRHAEPRDDRLERRFDEVLSRYDLRSVARETVGGRPAIVVEASALPGKREIRNDKYLRSLAGRFWIDEQDGHLLRAELHTTSPVRVGLGLVASVSEAEATVEFGQLEGDTWLPVRLEARGRARVLLVKGLHVRSTSTYGGFRRFDVETTEQLKPGT